MKKYYYLGWHLFIMTFVFYFVPSVMQRAFVYVSENANNLLWMLAIYLPRDFVDVSEYANNIIWLGNGVGLGWVIWFYVLITQRLKKYFRTIEDD